MSGPLLPESTAKGTQAGRRVGDTRGHDRQVLVVGDDIGAVVTAGFLDQSGLDPVLTTACPGRSRPPVVTLWQPGLELLERLGLRRPVERLGTALNSLDCLSSSRSWTAETSDRPSLVAISRERLDQLFEDQLCDRIRTTDQAVTNLVPTDTGVRVTFAQGIDEPFDTVVTASQRLGPACDHTGRTQTVDCWTFEWPAETDQPDGPTEVWAGDCAMFSVPVADTTFGRIVATSETDTATILASEDLNARFGHLFDTLDNPLPDLTQWDIQYTQTACSMSVSMCGDGIALVGQAVSGSFPGDCLGQALAIEDAWVLADSLTYGPASIDDALATYASRRRQRLTEITNRLDKRSASTRRCDDVSPVLQHLPAARGIAFGHLLESDGHELTTGIPDCL